MALYNEPYYNPHLDGTAVQEPGNGTYFPPQSELQAMDYGPVLERIAVALEKLVRYYEAEQKLFDKLANEEE